MSELLNERLRNSVDKIAKIFLINGFKFEGKITGCDDEYLEILEPKRGIKLLKLNEIKDVSIYNG